MNRSFLAASSVLACLLSLAGCAADGPPPADLVLLGGKIVTVEPDRAEVRALAARDGVIVALGDDEEIRRHVGDGTRVIELEGRLAIPGFIEGHAHFVGIGTSLMNLDLRDARSWNEVVERVGELARAANPGQWVLGWGWHQEKWDSPPRPEVEGYPTHDLLSRATPDNPVLLKHAAGSHAGMVNAAALDLMGIVPETPDPPGGTIVRDAKGRATGVLRERAYRLAIDAQQEWLSRRTPEEIEAHARHEIRLADRECLSKGIVSFQDAGSSFETVDRLRSVAEAGELGVRLWVMLNESNDALDERIGDYRIEGAGKGHLTVRAIKRLIDGALGSHGAWLLEPYEDLPETAGLNTLPMEELERTAEIAIENGFQLCVHAIGDRGSRETLDLYERTFGRHPDKQDLRWRVEHAQHLHPDDIPRFAELGVVAAMQAVHCTSDGPWVPKRLGQRRSEEGAYLWRELIDSGAIVSNGTDAPVEDVDPIANFHSAVTREMSDGVAFHPAQRMTRMEALEAGTINAATAAFEEDLKGSLRTGKLADVVVLSRDILTVEAEEIPDAEVLYTIVGGRVVHEK